MRLVQAGRSRSACRRHRRVHGRSRQGVQPIGFRQQVRERSARRLHRELSGKPATIQELARFLIAEANHCGVAKMLRRLSELAATDRNFTNIKIDCRREFWEAIRLGDFDTADSGFAEITHRRIYARPKPPEKAISTISQGEGPRVRQRDRNALRRQEFPGQARGKMSPLRRAQPRAKPSRC
jgi:hypothetical protein